MVFLRAIVLLAMVVGLTGCGKFFYQPDHYIYYSPEKLGVEAQDVLFTSGDGTKLHAWFIPASGLKKKEKPKGTIIQFHGNAQNLTSHYTSLVWLTKKGYNLFAFDYRGYGLSEVKSPNAEGLYKDGMSALDKAWELHQKTLAKNPKAKFIVYGQSLGGQVSMRSYVDFRHQDETSLVVMDSTFASYKDMIQEYMKKFFITWPFSPIGRLTVSDEFSSEKVLPRFKSNLLVIHSKDDPVVSIKNGKKIFEKATNAKSKVIWELEKVPHIAAYFVEDGKYREQFLKYLDDLK